MSAAARLLAVLWILTCATYLLSPQEGWPLYPWLAQAGKLPLVALGWAAGAAVLVFPENFFCLLFASGASGVAVLAWHSWLGAYQPLVAPAFLFLACTLRSDPGERRRLVLASFLLGEGAGLLHGLNRSFLAGYEFTPAGTLHKDFPAFFRPEEWSAGGPAACAVAWLVLWALPLPGILRGKKWGWALFAFACAALVVLYKVVFYAAFLIVPAALLFDVSFLRAWRWRMPRALPAPVAVFLAGEALFFVWYLFFRQNVPVYALSVALVLGASLGSRFDPSLLAPPAARWCLRETVWLAVWSATVAAPFLLPTPAPFGFTQFSAREAELPPAGVVEDPLGIPDCLAVRERLALRWGYRLEPWTGGCRLRVYR